MKNIIVFFLFLTHFSALSQEKGSLMHYQKKCDNCLALPHELYKSSIFTIYVPDSVYSGGQISIKKVSQETFDARKLLLVFTDNGFIKAEFDVKGKKNVASFEKWISTQLTKDPIGNTSLRVNQNGKTVSYTVIRKGNKIHVNIEAVD